MHQGGPQAIIAYPTRRRSRFGSKSQKRHRPIGQERKRSGAVKSANGVGLRYVSDAMPGIRRERFGKDFRYRFATGAVVRTKQVLDRIRRLVIPPAWTDVWICPDPNGHLQATGLDARGRKQNRYHPSWQALRDETKYNRVVAFARRLPGIRARLERDLVATGLSRRKVLATVVRLLETSLIRVGNEEYARQNSSFGLTTMRNRHVHVSGALMSFHFRGKGGKWHEVNIHDARLAKVVKNCQDLPGQELFQYVDEQGRRHKIRSNDVNDYLRQISKEDFTAKDFRTWAGTVQCALALRDLGPLRRKAQLKGNLAEAIKTVAKHLGNTPAVCRKCYVHPELLESYRDGTLARILIRRTGQAVGRSPTGLRSEEAAVLQMLRERAAGESFSRRIQATLDKMKHAAHDRQRAPRAVQDATSNSSSGLPTG